MAATDPDFLAAIVTYLRGLSSVGGTLGVDPWGNQKVYLREAPATVQYPFLLVTPITSRRVPTNSPTTQWKVKRFQYDLFASDPDQVATLGEAGYTAFSQVSPLVTYVTGYEFMRSPLSQDGDAQLSTLAGRNSLPEWRYMFEIEHMVGEVQ